MTVLSLVRYSIVYCEYTRVVKAVAPNTNIQKELFSRQTYFSHCFNIFPALRREK